MHKKAAAFTGFFTGLCNGLFGSGGGTLAVPCMEKFLDIVPQKAHATAIAVILPLSVISGLIYFYGVGIPVKDVILAGTGGALGGAVGARLLGRIKEKQLHIIFGIFMIAGGVRMMLG